MSHPPDFPPGTGPGVPGMPPEPGDELDLDVRFEIIPMSEGFSLSTFAGCPEPQPGPGSFCVCGGGTGTDTCEGFGCGVATRLNTCFGACLISLNKKLCQYEPVITFKKRCLDLGTNFLNWGCGGGGGGQPATNNNAAECG